MKRIQTNKDQAIESTEFISIELLEEFSGIILSLDDVIIIE